MPLHTTDALILRTYKLGESDRIVVFLTRDRGKKRGVAKNARQSRRRSFIWEAVGILAEPEVEALGKLDPGGGGPFCNDVDGRAKVILNLLR